VVALTGWVLFAVIKVNGMAIIASKTIDVIILFLRDTFGLCIILTL